MSPSHCAPFQGRIQFFKRQRLDMWGEKWLMIPKLLDPSSDFLAESFPQFESYFQKVLGEMDQAFRDTIGHLGKRRGKYLRPKLVLASARIYQSDLIQAIRMACMMELLHMATLLHDDVIDQGRERRGISTVCALWGNKQSILAGDYLSAYVYGMAVEQGSLEVVAILTNTIKALVKGETLQLQGIPSLSYPEETFWDVIDCKTSSLFKASLEIGSMFGRGRTEEEIESLSRFGLILGRLFQVADDYRDYFCESGPYSKTGGRDFYDGKVTLPVFWSYQEGGEEEKQFWERSFGGLKRTLKDFNTAQLYLKSPKTLLRIQKTAGFLLEEMKGILKSNFDKKTAQLYEIFMRIAYEPLEANFV